MTRPPAFLQQLVLQTHLLANLQWLCEYQVLACIPLNGAVAFEEVAAISNVPVDRLQAAVRLMATVGFLCEHTSGHLAHTPLSASFVTEPDLLDAALFLAQTAVPAALQLPRSPELASNTSAQAQMQPRMQRQFAAYLMRGIVDEAAAVNEVLGLVDWAGMGAIIVDIHPPSPDTVALLGQIAPAARLVVQTSSSTDHLALGGPDGWMTFNLPSSISSRVSVQSRAAGSTQTVQAAAYIIRVPSPTPTNKWTSIRAQTVSELQAHLQALHSNPGARLMLTALVLPAPGSLNKEVEAMVRLRDMTLAQLANDRQPSRADILELICTVQDPAGGLVVEREIGTPSSAAVVLEVSYQPSLSRVQ
ncbi:hypothetical protein BDV18DRAFT_167991 [Aspergillus unguis]